MVLHVTTKPRAGPFVRGIPRSRRTETNLLLLDRQADVSVANGTMHVVDAVLFSSSLR
jgi:hypothetical protein